MREPPATAAFVEPARLDRLQDRSRPVEARYRPVVLSMGGERLDTRKTRPASSC